MRYLIFLAFFMISCVHAQEKKSGLEFNTFLIDSTFINSSRLDRPIINEICVIVEIKNTLGKDVFLPDGLAEFHSQNRDSLVVFNKKNIDYPFRIYTGTKTQVAGFPKFQASKYLQANKEKRSLAKEITDNIGGNPKYLDDLFLKDKEKYILYCIYPLDFKIYPNGNYVAYLKIGPRKIDLMEKPILGYSPCPLEGQTLLPISFKVKNHKVRF